MATMPAPTLVESATFSYNPITAVARLGVVMEPRPGDPLEAWGVLNPATVRGRDDTLYLLARLVAAGNFSRIGVARVVFDGANRPAGVERLGVALEPAVWYEGRGPGEGGCEDPRITFIPALDRYVMTYTAYGPGGARVALAVSEDLLSWERLGLAQLGDEGGVDFDSYDNKDAFFFPEPVVAPNGAVALACAHRPMTGADHAGPSPLADLPPSIWISYVPLADACRDIHALGRLRQHTLVARPEYAWEQVKIGGGAPPVLTEQGWLLLYHGIENQSGPGEPRRLRYAAGAMLLDRLDPTQVLWRSPVPLFSPETAEELSGVVNNVVFPTGVDRLDASTLDVYYGMADARIGVARLWLRQESAGAAVDAA